MNAATTFNPHSMEGHYSLDLACFLLHARRPTSVRICSGDAETIKALLRRLGWVEGKGILDTPELVESLREFSPIAVEPYDGHTEADAAIVPFSRKAYETPPQASFIVTLSYNAISYKTLAYPGITRDTAVATTRWLRQMYQIGQTVGLFSPRFIVKWAISLAAGTRMPELHFRAGQQAVDHIYSSGRFWWTGYILVISAYR